MPWFKIDDQLHEHRKARAAGRAAMGVWVLAGSYCADNLTDGFVAAGVLPRWGTKADAARLVKAGLWHPCEQDGEAGWRFHDWDEFQPSRQQIEADRDAARDRMRKARGAKRSGEVRANTTRTFGRSSDNPVPVPVPNNVVAFSSQSSSVPRELDDDGLTRIQQALNGCPKAHARKSAGFVLAKAPADVRNPVAYVLAAIADDPDAYRYRRGNPKRGEECPTHAGEWADACRGCVADQKAAGA